ncbi:MAG: DUF4416 family protein [Candidatus Fermentibacteraceae bacterium]
MELTEARPAVLMVSVLYGAEDRLQESVRRLETVFGPVALRSDPYAFDMSDYYRPEMGGGLRRVWLAFAQPVPPDGLADWKLECASIEEDMSEDGRRTANLDPGYLDFGKLVLASFKEAPDKVYMGRGVWAHTCLRYGHGRFTAPDHSFPDFRDGRFDAFMRRARRLLRSSRSVSDVN